MTSILRATRSRLAERLAHLYRHDVANALAGTVTTNGTATIAGAGTSFLADYEAGALMQIAGEMPHEVASITSDVALTLTAAATTSGAGREHSNSQGLFEYFGGVIGTGSIDSPQVAARIQVWPVEALGETLAVKPLLMVQAVRPSGVFDMLPAAFDRPIYELMATLFLNTMPQELTAGELNSDDVFLHIRDVAIRGENVRVPGKLIDPDNALRELNISLSAMNEETPQRFRDVTLYPLRLAYTCSENARTGELLP